MTCGDREQPRFRIGRRNRTTKNDGGSPTTTLSSATCVQVTSEFAPRSRETDFKTKGSRKARWLKKQNVSQIIITLERSSTGGTSASSSSLKRRGLSRAPPRRQFARVSSRSPPPSPGRRRRVGSRGRESPTGFAGRLPSALAPGARALGARPRREGARASVGPNRVSRPFARLAVVRVPRVAMSLGDGAGPGAGAASSSDDDLRRVLDAALRLKHRLSLVATLPAVRRVRDFLNPGSRLPDSASPLVLLGRRHEAHASFAEDFAARTWVTYRRGFPRSRTRRTRATPGGGARFEAARCYSPTPSACTSSAGTGRTSGRPRRRSDPETNDERNETDERPSPADPEGNDEDVDVDSDSAPGL